MTMAPPPPYPSKPPGDWLSRNWKWLVWVAAGGAVAVALGFFFSLLALLKTSDAYAEAIVRANNSPAAREALGAPIKAGLLLSGSIQVSGGSGKADLAIPVAGPKGKATIYVEATKSTGVWRFDRLIVDVKSSKARIDLSDPSLPAESRDSRRL